MVYLKSVLVGVLTLFVALITLPMLGIVVYSWIHPQPEGYAIGWDPISLVKQPPLFLAALVIFALGFFWELRRLTHW